MTTPQLVRLALAHYRQHGYGFEEAWIRALRNIPRGGDNDSVKRDRQEWVRVLQATRDEWQAAYENAPPEMPGGPESELVAGVEPPVVRERAYAA